VLSCQCLRLPQSSMRSQASGPNKHVHTDWHVLHSTMAYTAQSTVLQTALSLLHTGIMQCMMTLS
jgi:hypothetical protein